MNKSQLCTRLAKQCQLPIDDAIRIVDVFFSSITQALMRGNRVEIRGLCSWQVKAYASYYGRNPNNGEMIEVPAKRLPFFKAGKGLVELLNAELAGKSSAATN